VRRDVADRERANIAGPGVLERLASGFSLEVEPPLDAQAGGIILDRQPAADWAFLLMTPQHRGKRAARLMLGQRAGKRAVDDDVSLPVRIAAVGAGEAFDPTFAVSLGLDGQCI